MMNVNDHLMVLSCLLFTCAYSQTIGGISTEDAKIALDKHLEKRAQEGAANMEYMTWNTILAEMAQSWAEACDFAHGQPPWPAGTTEAQKHHLGTPGQNLFMSKGAHDYATVIDAWAGEKQNYIYETGVCTHQPCGHYTQVVWAASTEVGCGTHFCPVLTDSEHKKTYNKYYYVVCQYAPGGNYHGAKPYIKGGSCSKCKSGKFWCSNNAFCRDCPKEGITCPCKINCKNNGVAVASDCSCNCADGWMGVDCSDACQDLNHNCGVAWPKAYVCHIHYFSSRCPAMCELCKTTRKARKRQKLEAESKFHQSKSQEMDQNV